MDSQIRISDLENVISEKVFIKIEKWNLYLGDAGLASILLLNVSAIEIKAHWRLQK